MWDQRYSVDEYVYGTAPNDFLRQQADSLRPGSALCLADGEGRNGVYLAELGHAVTSVDLSTVAMAKAAALADQRGVTLSTHVADLAAFDLGEARWDLVVSIFAHTPPTIRRDVHRRVTHALRPGGTLVLEAYTPDQIGRGTGGPPVAEMTMTLQGLIDELEGLDIVHGVELVRPVVEGAGHTGDGAVVQVVAVKPS
ncbi:MAG: class I SAM-dependent methyltransferase [Acidimicrobiales bacterium]|nr:class I SAM-dependent methyltransferase [Acidimicrobiales bacterium]